MVKRDIKGDFARKIPSQTLIKGGAAAAGGADDDTIVVRAFMIYNTAPPSHCMRNAYYRRNPHVVERKKIWSFCSRPANVPFKLKCAPFFFLR